jgi:hypothetical protein
MDTSMPTICLHDMVLMHTGNFTICLINPGSGKRHFLTEMLLLSAISGTSTTSRLKEAEVKSW